MEAYVRLLGPEGRRVLDSIAAAGSGIDDLALGTRLRRTYDADLVAAAMTLARLRTRGRAKFGADAERMYFTADGLEQATRSRVAEHRAARVARDGPAALLDLGCGIGSDLIAAARTGLAITGVDRDPVRVAYARANLEVLGLHGDVREADATAYPIPPDTTVFADPARRGDRGRVFDPDAFEPPWSFVAGLLDGPAAVKTMPGLPHELVPPGVEAEWVSDDGDLVEACLWGAPLARCTRRATVLPHGSALTDADEPDKVPVGEMGAYVYEPDDAVIRAHLVGAVAARVEGRLLDRHLAYVTGDAEVHTVFARGFRVLEEVPFREKQLKAALRTRGIGTLTVKKRGVGVVPEQLIRRLGLHGDRTATLLLARVGAGSRAWLVEPIG